MLRFSVKGTGGLVEEENLGLPDQGPSNGDPLLLSPGELDSSFPYNCIVSLGEERLVLDKRESVCLGTGLIQFCVGDIFFDSVYNVAPNAAREKNRFLLYDSHVGLE